MDDVWAILAKYDGGMSLREKFLTRRTLVDALIAVAVLVLGFSSSVEVAATDAELYARDPDFFGYLLIALMSLPLVLRRIYPVTVMWIVVLAWGVDRIMEYPFSLAMFGMVFALHSVGSELSRQRSLRIGGAAVLLVTGWTALGAATIEAVSYQNVFILFLMTVAPLHLGREVNERRRQVQELEERAERAEREREERARQAVEEERARIARELHDVVAHQMTVMTIQAEGASRVADGSDPRVVEALSTIKDTGHSALAEMRRVVGLLRTADGSDPALTPLPTLDGVEALVATVRVTGMPVELVVEGQKRRLDEGTELSAYRVIQESLTNAVRHGGPDVTARVKLDFGSDHLDVIVEDDGRGAAANSTEPGHGLVGMRERVAVLGGEFEAGPKPGGGYRVHARIPAES